MFLSQRSKYIFFLHELYISYLANYFLNLNSYEKLNLGFEGNNKY